MKCDHEFVLANLFAGTRMTPSVLELYSLLLNAHTQRSPHTSLNEIARKVDRPAKKSARRRRNHPQYAFGEAPSSDAFSPSTLSFPSPRTNKADKTRLAVAQNSLE